MRILVTGGSGFIGSHFVEHILAKTNWEVTVLDSLTYSGDLERLKHQKEKIRFIHHDICAPIVNGKSERLGQFDYIVHFAAESHVENSLHDPLKFVMSNVVGTANVLEFARTQGNLKTYVQISTDEVFGPAPKGVYHKEWDRVKPSNPYSASKAGGDALAIAYATCYQMPVIITRTMNNFGERQHPEKYIPMVMQKVLDGEKVTVHGTQDNIGERCWLHARNHADGVLFLLNSYSESMRGDIFNISGEEYNNLEIAQMIAKSLGRELKYVLVDFHKTRPGHDLRYSLDNKKMSKMGWRPPVQMAESLDKMVKWTMNNTEWLK